MEPAVPVPLRTQCPKCHRMVTIFMTAWSDEAIKSQTWKCPHCHEPNHAELPGKIQWVAARQSEG